jgi:hypothetical protein
VIDALNGRAHPHGRRNVSCGGRSSARSKSVALCRLGRSTSAKSKFCRSVTLLTKCLECRYPAARRSGAMCRRLRPVSRA